MCHHLHRGLSSLVLVPGKGRPWPDPRDLGSADDACHGAALRGDQRLPGGGGWIDWVMKLVKIGDTIMGLFEISVDFDYKLSYLIIFVKLSLLPPMCGVFVCV